MNPISVLIVEDHKLWREAWQYILKLQPNIRVIGACSTGEEAYRISKNESPDIVLLDISLKEEAGQDIAINIKKCCPNIMVIALSVHADVDNIRSMTLAGCEGYITKNSSTEEMLEGIGMVHRGKSFMCEEAKKVCRNRMIPGLPISILK